LHSSLKSGVRYLIMGLFLLLYAGLNFYLGIRCLEALGSYLSTWDAVYWGLIIFLASAYFLGLVINRKAPGKLSDALVWIGAYYIGFFFYGLLTVLLIDVLRCVDKIVPFIPMMLKDKPALTAGIVLLFLTGLMVYGTCNSRRPVLRKYRLDVPGHDLRLKNLKAVLVSDVHLGNIVGRKRLTGLVRKINQRQADVVLLAGDVIDGDARPFVQHDMAGLLRQIKSRYGVLAVLGNHEYLGGQYKEMISALQASGVTVLRDESVLLQDSLYIIGRDDKYSRNRRKLAELMPEPGNHLPVLILDHNPADIQEAASNGADLQFSGHTHTGQIWPLNFITAKIFATDWGYLRQGKLQVIVSNGYATWGPPIRIGNRPELVEIIIRFR